MLSELTVRGDGMAAVVTEEVVALQASSGGHAFLASKARDRNAGGGAGRAAGVVSLMVVIVRVVIVLT